MALVTSELVTRATPRLGDRGFLMEVILAERVLRIASTDPEGERRPELHEAFISLACSLICWRRLKKHQS